MLALLASSASAAYKMHLYEDLACTDAPWEISFEGSTCTGDDPFLWTDGDRESLPRPGYYFKNGLRSFQYDPTTHGGNSASQPSQSQTIAGAAGARNASALGTGIQQRH